MKVVNCGPHTLKIHDSVMSIPPHKESMMMYYQMSEMGIGHSWESIDGHLNSLIIAAGQADQTAIFQQVENLRLSYYSMAAQYNPEQLSWLCLIHEIDGQPFNDLTEETLKEWAQKLSVHDDSEFAWRQVFEEVKKKFPTSFESTFQNGPAPSPIFE